MNALLFFASEFDLDLDAKNRLSIPADVRRDIDFDAGPEVPETAPKLFLTLRNRIPCLYTARYYKALVQSNIRPRLVEKSVLVDYAHLRISMSNKLGWDNQGRVVLPERVIERARLGRELTLVGCNDHLEIWNRADWLKRADFLLDHSEEIENKAEVLLDTTEIDSEARASKKD